jgi:hypothetical protein
MFAGTMTPRRSTGERTASRTLALIAVAFLVPLTALTPAFAAPGDDAVTVAPNVYDLRLEAVGASLVYDDEAFLFPYADPALPYAEGSLTSPGDAAGFAAVFDPGTAVTGLPTLVAAARPDAPPVPPYPGAVQTQAGSTEDATAPAGAASPDGTAVAGRTTSHSDARHTEQQATAARVTFPGVQQAVLTVESATAHTLGRLTDDGTVSAVSEVVLAGLSAPQVEVASLHARVALTVPPGGEPAVERSLAVTGLAVGGQQLALDERGVVAPGAPEHDATLGQVRQAAGQATGAVAQVTVIQGGEITADGTVTASSDTLRIDVPVPGTLQVVTVLLGTAAVTSTTGDLDVPAATAPSALLPATAAPSAAAPPGPVGVLAVTSLASIPLPAEAPLPPFRPGQALPLPAARASAPPEPRTPLAAASAIVRRTDRTWLVFLYLFWLCLCAAIVTAAAKPVLAAPGLASGTELFD